MWKKWAEDRREKRCETSWKLNVQCFDSNKLHCYCLLSNPSLQTPFLSFRIFLSFFFTHWTLFCVSEREKKMGTLHRSESRKKNRFTSSSCFSQLQFCSLPLRDTFSLTFLQVFFIQVNEREKMHTHKNRMKYELFSQFSEDISNNWEKIFYSRHVASPFFSSRFFGPTLPLVIFSEKIQTENLFSTKKKQESS